VLVRRGRTVISTDETKIIVEGEAVETADIRADTERLAALVARTKRAGGRLFRPEEGEALLGELRKLPGMTTTTFQAQADLWDRLPLLVFFLLLLLADWGLRWW